VSILFRRRIRLGPFLAVNLSRSGLSWTAHLGPWSWNTRTRRHRVDLPGPFGWQQDRPRRGKAGSRWPMAAAVLLTAALAVAVAWAGLWAWHHVATNGEQLRRTAMNCTDHAPTTERLR